MTQQAQSFHAQPISAPEQGASSPHGAQNAYADLGYAVADKPHIGLWRLSAGFRRLYLGATLTLGVGAAARTGSSLLIAYLVDNVLLTERETGSIARAILLVAVALVALAVFEGAMTYWSGRLTARTSEGIARRLRNYLFDHLQRLNFTYHDRNQTGDLIQRASSDVAQISRFYQEQGVEFGRIALLFAVNFAALCILNVQLALFSVIAVPLLAVLSVFFFRRISKIFDAYQTQEGVVSTVIQENLSGVRVVKAFARQGYEMDKFARENRALFTQGRRLTLMHTVYWPLSDLIVAMQTLGVLVVGALMVMDGALTLGSYVAFLSLLTWIMQPMRNLGRIIVQMSSGLVSYKRVADVLRQTREPLTEGSVPADVTLRGEVVFRDVRFEYLPGKPVLEGISFRVRAGQSVALLGSTGSGKTTLVSLLPRFYEYTSGSLTIDGHEVREIPRAVLRQAIGIVEQEPFLFSRTLRENITYGVGREVSDEEVFAAARAAAVHDVILGFPDGYATLVGERGVTLSGGQKQRVALARTLLRNPRILLLDDATSSVDMETEAAIRTALDGLMQDRTTFIIAHRVQSVMNADLILVMDHGRIVQQGTHETLMNEPGIYRQIYDLQARVEDELKAELEAPPARVYDDEKEAVR